jgi:hypothetical protein
MKWEDLSESARDAMRELGGFEPTRHPESKTLRGTMYDADYGVDTAYFSCEKLREFAAAMVEVADWLEKRAQESEIEVPNTFKLAGESDEQWIDRITGAK